MLGSPSPLPVKRAPKEKVSPAQPGKETQRIKEAKAVRPTFTPPNLYWRLAVAAILGPILIGGIFLSRDRLRVLVKEIEGKRGQLVALSERETSFKKVSLDLASVKEEIPLLEKALPNEEGIIEFLNQVEKIKEETEVEIKTFRFDTDQPRPDEGGNHYIELVLEASGPIASLEKFLTTLLNLPILIKTKMVDITKMDEGISQLILKAWLYVDPNFFLDENEKD